MITCVKCGAQNRDGETFCSHCSSFLEWTGRSDAPTTPAAVLPQAPLARPRPSLPTTGPSLLADLAQATPRVEPGSTATFTIVAQNTGRTVDQVGVEVFGGLAPWARVQPPNVNLLPGGRESLSVQFALPRTAEVPAGTYEIGFAVLSKEHPDQPVYLRTTLEVAQFVEYEADLSPKIVRARHRGRYRVRITNTGNVPLAVAIAGSDPEAVLRFNAGGNDIVVAPGATAGADVYVTAPGWRLRGSQRTMPFLLTATPGAGQKRVLDGILNQTVALHGFVPLLGLIAGAALAALAAVAVLRPFGPDFKLPWFDGTNVAAVTTPAPTEQPPAPGPAAAPASQEPPTPTQEPPSQAPPTEPAPTPPTATEAPTPTGEPTPTPAPWWTDAAAEALSFGFDLGRPTAEGTTTEGLRFEDFEAGIVVERQDGIYWVPQVIRERWAGLGGSGADPGTLGYPIASLKPARDGGHSRGMFDNGTIYWDVRGTYAVTGPLWVDLVSRLRGLDNYKGLNLGIPDWVGYPDGDSQYLSEVAAFQSFESGFLWIADGQSGWCNLRQRPDKDDQPPYCAEVPVPDFVPLPQEFRQTPNPESSPAG